VALELTLIPPLVERPRWSSFEWFHIRCKDAEPGFLMKPRGAVWKWPLKIRWAVSNVNGPSMQPDDTASARKESM